LRRGELAQPVCRRGAKAGSTRASNTSPKANSAALNVPLTGYISNNNEKEKRMKAITKLIYSEVAVVV